MKHNLLKSVIISVILLMGVSNTWANHGFYQVDITYSSGGNSNNYTFYNTDNTSTTFDLGSHSSPFVIQTMKLYCWDDWGDKSYTNNSGQFIYRINNGSANYFGSGSLTKSSYSGNNFQLYKNDCNLTLAAASGKYTFNLKWQAWGWGDNSDCYVDNQGKGYTWKYTILPPEVSSIGISASGHLAGSGTQADPYVLVYGGSLELTASVNNSDANSNTHFTFGSNTASTTKTHTISNITNATAQKITIKAQNINKSDNSLKGTALSKDIYYKYTPVYVYINGQSHQINNTTKQVTVALNRNANDETYTFKVHDNNNHWLGNSGTMERGGTSVHSGGWTMSVDDKNDCKLKADLTGNYTFTFIPAGNKVTVTYPQKSYFIAGSWDDWAGTAPAFVDASTPVSIHLTGDKVYNFKIANLTGTAAYWYGNEGEMQRTNCTAWPMETGKNDCHIYADITGEYKFTFNSSTKKLTVTYPEYTTKTVYLDLSQFADWRTDAPVIKVEYDDVKHDLTTIGCAVRKEDVYYYQVELPAEKIVRFHRTDPANSSTSWNSIETSVPTDAKNCFTITGWETGEWTTFEEIYPVTLDPHADLAGIDFGSYSVRYNGTTYTSKPSETVTFYVPAGAQIEILEGDPINDAYYARVRAQIGGNGGTIYGDDNNGLVGQTIEICGQTNINCWFFTKKEYTVYLGIPSSSTFDEWRQAGETKIWDRDSKFDGLVSAKRSFEIGNITYHEFEIPAGSRNMQFELKNGSSTIVSTRQFPYEIPTTNINCFTLTSETDGVWSELPGGNGDFRLLYIEQEIAKEDWKTVINTTYQHSSDFIRKNVGGTDIVSLHVKRNKELNPEIILQQMKNGDWVDIERHMVMGPLQTDNAGVAMLPGRRNAAGNLIYDDGIEVIKNDGTYPGRVYNFKVQQFQSAATNADTAQLLLDVENLKPYSGDYYIRTDNAVGGWNQYLTSGNVMNYSKYAEDHSGFSHYFCKYVDIAEDPKNVKFVIANDHGTAISDELDGDDFVPKENNGSIYKGELQESANVRWSWNQYTNEVKRAYIKGSSENGFLTVTQTGGTTTNFKDNGNWIYEADITAEVGDKITAITAPYRTKNQSLLELTYQTEGMPLLTGDPSGTHKIRVMYDFKINKTMALLVPGTGVKTTIDVLIERTDHGQATQVANAIHESDGSGGYTVYAALNFTKNNVENAPYTAQRLYYWVSFPFDVRISEVFGFGEYGKHWIMQYYDGAARAANGAWADSPSYWRNITDTTVTPNNSTTLNSGILKANQGYVLALAKKIATMGVFDYTDKVTLYFPSMKKQKIMQPGVQEIGITLDPYQCTINRPTPNGDRRILDSHWHVLGVPSYSDHSQKLTQDDLMFFYQRDYEDADGYTVQSAQNSSVTLQSLYSYYVQFAGTINWSATWTLNGTPLEIAARKNVAEEESHNLRLELQQNGVNADQTFITLKDEDGITPMFDMNKDLSKIINSGANIYTLIDTETGSIEVAGNTLPIASTIIPVGVQVATAGEYTFAMPDGTDGIIVELVDYDTNTRTNLLLSDYTVTLPAGTNESRFALHVQPSKVTTSTENISGDGNTNTKKYLLDGVLYLQKDGVLYDAQGRCVK